MSKHKHKQRVSRIPKRLSHMSVIEDEQSLPLTSTLAASTTPAS